MFPVCVIDAVYSIESGFIGYIVFNFFSFFFIEYTGMNIGLSDFVVFFFFLFFQAVDYVLQIVLQSLR